MKRFLLLFAPAVVTLFMCASSASANSYVYAYSTVDYDSATDTVTGYSYTSYPYGAGLYYEPYVSAVIYDEDGNYAADTSFMQTEGGSAEITFNASGYGCQYYRIDGYHAEDAYYYVSYYYQPGYGYTSGWDDVDNYSATSEDPYTEPLPDATFFGNGPITIRADQFIELGVTEAVGSGNCTPAPRVQIKRNGNVIADSSNGAYPAQTVSVGEKISLTTTVNRGTTSASPHPQWTIDGVKVANYDENSGTQTDLTTTALQGTGVDYYWVDGGDNRSVVYTASVNGHPYTATAKFNVKRPTSSLSAVTSVVTLGTASDGHGNNPFGLHFGKPDDPTPTIGMTFSLSVTMPSGISGHWELMQVVSPSRSRTPATGSTQLFQGMSVADGTFPYSDTSDESTDQDSPGLEADPCLYTALSVNDPYSMYLMFKPTLQSGSAIYVPLKKLDWSFIGTGTRTGGCGSSWTLTNDSPHAATTISGQDTTSFPRWTQSTADLRWQ
jgi:hypothetical protein